MKKWLIGLLCCCMFLLPACAADTPENPQEVQSQNAENQNNESQNEANQNAENQNAENQAPAAAVTYTGQYADVLQTYHTALSNQWNGEALIGEGLSLLLPYCYEGNPLANVGYALMDVNGDSKDELIIGAIQGDAFVEKMVFALYTMTDEGPLQVFAGEERNRYYIMAEEAGGYFFANEGSGGAGSSVWFYDKLDGTELVLTQGIVYDSETDAENPWYMVYEKTYQGSADTAVDAKLAEDIIAAAEKQYVVLDYTPFDAK